MLLFLAASLLSLLIGRATWDPSVPVGGNFLLVQFAQWAIFAFSALAFWLAGNLIVDTRWLWRLTALFLLVGGGLAILSVLPGLGRLTGRFATIAFIRAPFWVLLAALAAGQLLFNRRLVAAVAGVSGRSAGGLPGLRVRPAAGCGLQLDRAGSRVGHAGLAALPAAALGHHRRARPPAGAGGPGAQRSTSSPAATPSGT